MALPPLPQGQRESMTRRSILAVSPAGSKPLGATVTLCASVVPTVEWFSYSSCVKDVQSAPCHAPVVRLPQHTHCLLPYLHQAAERRDYRTLVMGSTGTTKGLGFSVQSLDASLPLPVTNSPWPWPSLLTLYHWDACSLNNVLSLARMAEEEGGSSSWMVH